MGREVLGLSCSVVLGGLGGYMSPCMGTLYHNMSQSDPGVSHSDTAYPPRLSG